METKNLILIGVVVLVVVGIIWLLSLLPGFGLGLGGGGGGSGKNGTDGKNGKPPGQTQPLPGTEEEVIVTGDKAIYKNSNKPVTPEELLAEAKKGRRFVVVDKDGQRKTMDAFRAVAKQSDNRITIKGE